jgi:hypothetical protein
LATTPSHATVGNHHPASAWRLVAVALAGPLEIGVGVGRQNPSQTGPQARHESKETAQGSIPGVPASRRLNSDAQPFPRVPKFSSFFVGAGLPGNAVADPGHIPAEEISSLKRMPKSPRGRNTFFRRHTNFMAGGLTRVSLRASRRLQEQNPARAGGQNPVSNLLRTGPGCRQTRPKAPFLAVTSWSGIVAGCEPWTNRYLPLKRSRAHRTTPFEPGVWPRAARAADAAKERVFGSRAGPGRLN